LKNIFLNTIFNLKLHKLGFHNNHLLKVKKKDYFQPNSWIVHGGETYTRRITYQLSQCSNNAFFFIFQHFLVGSRKEKNCTIDFYQEKMQIN